MTRTKIDTNLTPTQRDNLVTWCLERSANPTGALIIEGLHELGLWETACEPSVVSVNEWRKSSLSMDRIRLRTQYERKAAQRVAAGAGEQFSRANREQLEAILFDHVAQVRSGEADLDLESLSDLVLAVSRLAKTSQKDAELEIALEKTRLELERTKREADAMKSTAADDNLTPEERLAKIRKGLGIS